jgi:hypothetical protein
MMRKVVGLNRMASVALRAWANDIRCLDSRRGEREGGREGESEKRV